MFLILNLLQPYPFNEYLLGIFHEPYFSYHFICCMSMYSLGGIFLPSTTVYI